MITIKNVKNISGEIVTITIESIEEYILDAEGKLTILPALIDPHVHFRTPGHEHKENWISASEAAIAGGVTTVFDMPNTSPSCTTAERLHDKKALIDNQLKESGIPLRYHLYFGGTAADVEEINKVKDEIVGVKVYMGSSTGDLLLEDPEALDRLFQICAQKNLIVAIHGENEQMLRARQHEIGPSTDPATHSRVRDRSAAIKAVQDAIALAEKYSTELAVLHVSTKEEIELIRQAKQNELLVFCEISPHHLLLSEADYAKWGTKVQVNPPLRTTEDQEALWAAIEDGTVDMIGTDHAPHTLEEKNLPYGEAPSGVPGIEFLLPLLLNAHHEGKISLKKIIELTRKNCETIFNLPHNDDVVLVDLEKVQEVKDEHVKSKCGWSPYTGRTLKGWPIYTILKGKVYHVHHDHSISTVRYR